MQKVLRQIKKTTAAVCLAALAAALIPGCGKEKAREASGTAVYFDTVVDIRIQDPDAEKLLQGCFELCAQSEKTLSAQAEDSELYRLNHRTEPVVEVSEELAQCILKGLEYGALSGGRFDITILPLRELWDFESENASVPPQEAIDAAGKKVDYRKVRVEGTTVYFDDSETQIDLGGIAKGYISAKLKAYLEEYGCTSALINLGGNVSVPGPKADGSSWVVGIQEPFADRGTVLETVEISRGCVISSGTYERYFAQDGVSYHHILDPDTGYPAETKLEQASVIGEDDVLCDAFSTICILAGKEEAVRLAEENGLDIRILFVNDEHEKEWYP